MSDKYLIYFSRFPKWSEISRISASIGWAVTVPSVDILDVKRTSIAEIWCKYTALTQRFPNFQEAEPHKVLLLPRSSTWLAIGFSVEKHGNERKWFQFHTYFPPLPKSFTWLPNKRIHREQNRSTPNLRDCYAKLIRIGIAHQICQAHGIISPRNASKWHDFSIPSKNKNPDPPRQNTESRRYISWFESENSAITIPDQILFLFIFRKFF